RSQNPTRERLERAVAALEGATHGIAFASGSAATAAIAQLAVAGDEIVVGGDVYGGTYRYFERVHRAGGVDARYVDLDKGADRLRFLQNAMGAVPGPLDCFLVLRGIRTLHLRMERHCANALAVARFLAGRDDVEWVSYPGLADGPRAHPSAALAARQMRAGG